LLGKLFTLSSGVDGRGKYFLAKSQLGKLRKKDYQ